MIGSVRTRNIGSFFESPGAELTRNKFTPPWEDSQRVTYVQTARQALAAIAVKYAKEGRNILLAPEYLCGSMLHGFDTVHWQLELYQVTESFAIDSENLVSKVTDPLRTVVLSATYFGNEPNDQHISAMKLLRAQGARVIEDETHRVLGPLEPLGDVAVASLRKVLPVADGAYIRGDSDIYPEIEREHSGWKAMDQKRSGYLEAARNTYKVANTELNSWLSPPARASDRTLRTLPVLDYQELKRRRRENGAVLRGLLGELTGIQIINHAEIPSHLVIRVPDAEGVQRRLASAGIFCPIHWPRPDRLQTRAWRENVLSLPVDHRYNSDDMGRVAKQLRLAVVK